MFRFSKKDRNKNRRGKKRVLRNRRLLSESLEDRKLLAAVTVNNGTSDVNAPDLSSITALISDDGGDGISLREAITAANNTAGADTLTLAQDVTLTAIDNTSTENSANGLPITTGQLTIEGGGHTIARSSAADTPGFRILQNAGNLTLNHLTLSGGQLPAGVGPYGGGFVGGGILNTGTLTINESTISGNRTSDFTNSSGGGIANLGVLNVNRTDITNNYAYTFGGGVLNQSGATATINQSLIRGNTAERVGGGGGIGTYGSVTINNSTLSGNNSDYGAGLAIGRQTASGSATVNNTTITGNNATTEGGGIYLGAAGSTLDLNQSIVSGNSAFAGNEVHNKYSATNITTNTNLFGHSGETNAESFVNFTAGSNDITATSDGSNSTALTGILNPTLADNGGSTLSHALVSGSPAVDVTPNSVAFTAGHTVDQTGQSRIQGVRFDLGAVESSFSLPPEAEMGGVQGLLIDAINAANSDSPVAVFPAGSGADTITLVSDVTLGSIDNTSPANSANGLPITSGELTINGGGHAISRSSAADTPEFRILQNAGNLTLNHLTLSGGQLPAGVGPYGGGFVGGGILNTGTLTINESTISGNRTSDFTNSSGGGIANLGVLNVNRTDITNNYAYTFGGGVLNQSGATATINQSLIRGNTAERVGGGGGIGTYGSVTINNSTLSGNNSDYGAGLAIGRQTASGSATVNNTTITGNNATTEGGGIYLGAAGSTLDLNQSIVSGNSAFAGNEVHNKYSATNITTNTNLFGHSGETNAESFVNFTTGSNDITATSDGSNSTALTGILNPTLADNGGSTLTHDVSIFGPAIDASNTGTSVDQIGTSRPQGERFDLGAVEATTPIPELIVDTVSDVVDGDLSAGNLSLREATLLAKSRTITFDPSLAGQTLTLAGGQLSLTHDVTINGDIDGDGKADITISGNNSSRIFDISGIETDVVLNSLTLTNGSVQGLGGAIRAEETRSLDIRNSTISGNSASAYGGGIFTHAISVTLTNTLVANNVARRRGGGIYAYGGFAGHPGVPSNVTLTNTTVHNNQSFSFFGGIGAGSAAHFEIRNSTVANNRANRVGGIGSYGGKLRLYNTVIASNVEGSNQSPSDASTITSAFNSFFGVAANIQSGSGNTNGGGDPGLMPLADNGGPALTQNLNAGSPLIDAGDNAHISVGNDANGNTRIVSGTVDIGATEVQAPALLSLTRHMPATQATDSDTLVFRATFDRPVNNVTSDDFVATGTTATVTGVNTVDAMTYELTVSGGDLAELDGTVGIDLASSQDIVRPSGEPLPAGEPGTDETYTVGNGPTFVNGMPASSDLTTFPGKILVSVMDPSAVASVQVSMQSPFRQFFDGTAFASSQPVYVTATLESGDANNGVWSIPFSANSFPESQNYVMQVLATDILGNTSEGQPAVAFFGFNADLTVDTPVDESDGDFSAGDLSLREAIELANASAATNIIAFDASVFNGESADVIRLTEGQLNITDSMHINGGTQNVVISGDRNGNDVLIAGTFVTDVAASESSTLSDNNGRVLDITAPSGDEVRLTALTITGGNVNGNGGGIISGNADLVIADSSISGNRATGRGGGVHKQFSAGSLTLSNSTVSGNKTTADWGGGLYSSSTPVTIEHSTIVENSSALNGGGVVTFGTTTFNHSIVVGNTASGAAPDFAGTGSMQNFSGSHNLLGTGDAFAAGSSNNQTGVSFANANIGPLADNGGSTFTHALLSGSPAINAGDPASVAGQNGVPAFDQRGTGFDRVRGPVDIGAFEVQNLAPIMPADASVNVAENTTLVGTFAGTDPGDTLTYSLSGNDAARFNINTSTGEVSFAASPNFESPTDADADGVYEITVTATDAGGLTDQTAISVAVTDLIELAKQDITIGHGNVQRSRIETLSIQFDAEVTVASDAFSVLKHGPSGGAVTVNFTTRLDTNGHTVADLTFAGAFVQYGSLTDGNYQLTIDGTKVTSVAGSGMDTTGDGWSGNQLVFGDVASDNFFRLYGDMDGDGDTDANDLTDFFAPAFFSTIGSSAYVSALDGDNDGDIDANDLNDFFGPNFFAVRDSL